jgi:hypothetical protein
MRLLRVGSLRRGVCADGLGPWRMRWVVRLMLSWAEPQIAKRIRTCVRDKIGELFELGGVS